MWGVTSGTTTLVVMELDDNIKREIMKQPNVGVVKQEEATEGADIPLEGAICTSKLENVSTEDQYESTSLNTFDVVSKSLELKSETVVQDSWLQSDQDNSVKEELLHEELDIKTEDEAIQETTVEDKHNVRNKFGKHGKHPSDIKLFKCDICDHSCSNKSNFKRHLRTHTGEKPFRCNACDHSFIKKQSLENHLMITHAGKKRFKCNVCDKDFGRRSNFNKHLRIHTGEKPFRCNACDHSYKEKRSLEHHLKIIHAGEKPFKCNVCDKDFGSKDYLKFHLRIHTGVKPF